MRLHCHTVTVPSNAERRSAFRGKKMSASHIAHGGAGGRHVRNSSPLASGNAGALYSFVRRFIAIVCNCDDACLFVSCRCSTVCHRPYCAECRVDGSPVTQCNWTSVSLEILHWPRPKAKRTCESRSRHSSVNLQDPLPFLLCLGNTGPYSQILVFPAPFLSVE